ncbi:hypothetical protein [Mycobacteroides immunogenum]|uniref:hypothetical protein n=1 Tax=Mycobacteroides immunogenum TaxID=83262 RepID=UPI003F49D39D
MTHRRVRRRRHICDLGGLRGGYAHISTTADAATNVGKAGSDFFANTLRTPVPAGELTDFLDTATSMHAMVFGTLQGALATSLHDYIVSVQTSYQAYKQTGAWANPTVTFA